MRRTPECQIETGGDLIERVMADEHPGKRYFNFLPRLITRAKERIRQGWGDDSSEVNCEDRGKNGDNGDEVIRRQLKSGGIVWGETFNDLVKAAADKVGKAIWEEVVPNLLACTEISTGKGAFGPAYRKTFENLVRGAREGNLEVITPACPPYDYMITREGLLRHQSGKLLPSIGERFGLAVRTLKIAFYPLEELGVKVSFTVVTYTGVTGNLDDLVELGGDVISYYRGNERQIFENLQAATAGARQILKEVWGDNGEVVSIEATLSSQVKIIVEEFQKEFPRVVSNHFLLEREEGKKVGEWLRTRLGVNENWLLFFVEQEDGYRRKQGTIFDRSLEPLVLTALKEGLLYLLMVKKVEKEGGVMVDLETTENYMAGMLRHYCGPVIMGREFDWKNPFDPTRIRQPFNLPVRL